MPIDFERIRNRLIHLEERLAPINVSCGVLIFRSSEEYFYKGDTVFSSASLAKLPILMEYLIQRRTGTLEDSESFILKDNMKKPGGILTHMTPGTRFTLRDLVFLMITLSDNTASNLILDRLGMENVNRLTGEMGLTDTILMRRFMERPEEKGTDNFTTATNMIRLMENLFRGNTLTLEESNTALEILQLQFYREKIPLFLPPEVKVANKTGTRKGIRHDCGIVFKPDTPYAVCFLTENTENPAETDMEIARMSREIYDMVN